MRKEMIDIAKRLKLLGRGMTKDNIEANKEYWCEVVFSKILNCKHHGAFNKIDLQALANIPLLKVLKDQFIELKTLHKWHTKDNTLGVGGLNSKRKEFYKGLCDWVLVYDGKFHRASLIPASVMFRKGVCYVDPKGKLYFRFSVKKGNCKRATKVFNKYMLKGFGFNEAEYPVC